MILKALKFNRLYEWRQIVCKKCQTECIALKLWPWTLLATMVWRNFRFFRMSR